MAGTVGRRLVSQVTRADLQRASWIRSMFERGAALRKRHGRAAVYDYSLGNPSFEPPQPVRARLRELVNVPIPGMHAYMPNPGYEEVRLAVAEYLSNAQELKTPLTANHVVMTCGAGGALNVIFESVLDPGDEVLVPAPYFVEYGFYVSRHRGRLVPVQSRDDFQLDLEALERAVNEKTKVILINSPNNPTGVIYSRESLEKLQQLISQKEQEYGNTILLISDEPYSKLVYDGVRVAPVLQVFPHSVLVTSHSKDLGLAGERIGYLGISPLLEEAAQLFGAATFNIRILGFVNAPALMQRLVAELQEEVVGLEQYAERRNLLYQALTEMGYDIVRPGGAFYLFPRSPIDDDVAFCKAALDHLLLLVPGSGFGRRGYFRISYSSIEPGQIRASLPAFQALAEKYSL